MKKFFAITLIYLLPVTMLGSDAGYRADKDRIKNIGYNNGYYSRVPIFLTALGMAGSLANYFFPPESSNIALTRNCIGAGVAAAGVTYGTMCYTQKNQQEVRKLIEKYPSKKEKLEYAYDKQHAIGMNRSTGLLVGGVFIQFGHRWHKNNPTTLALSVFGASVGLMDYPRADYPYIMREAEQSQD